MRTIRIGIFSDSDIVTARQQGRALAEGAGLGGSDLTLLATIISEVARTLAENPLPGELTISVNAEENQVAVALAARVHLADRTMGLDVSPQLGTMDGFRVSVLPEETLLTWSGRGRLARP